MIIKIIFHKNQLVGLLLAIAIEVDEYQICLMFL